MACFDTPNKKGIKVPVSIIFRNSNNNHDVEMFISKPLTNMQSDDAAFEGWSFLLHCNGFDKVTLNFDPNLFDIAKMLEAKPDFSTKEQHGIRFLFRLTKFIELFSNWFFIHPNCKQLLDQFNSNFNSLLKINNKPSRDSNPNKKRISNDERRIEDNIINNKNNDLEKIIKSNKFVNKNIRSLYNQLPVSLFSNLKSNTTKFFNGGAAAIDFWGIGVNDKSLNIFELKFNNNKVGIISELFFYANYCFLFYFHPSNSVKLLNSKIGSEYRGYDELITYSKSGFNKLNAYFFVDQLHPEIKQIMNCILLKLNQNSSKSINYDLIYYLYNKIDDSIIIK